MASPVRSLSRPSHARRPGSSQLPPRTPAGELVGAVPAVVQVGLAPVGRAPWLDRGTPATHASRGSGGRPRQRHSPGSARLRASRRSPYRSPYRSRYRSIDREPGFRPQPPYRFPCAAHAGSRRMCSMFPPRTLMPVTQSVRSVAPGALTPDVTVLSAAGSPLGHQWQTARTGNYWKISRSGVTPGRDVQLSRRRTASERFPCRRP